MSIRDVCLIACSAAISSLLTWSISGSKQNVMADKLRPQITEKRKISVNAESSKECINDTPLVSIEHSPGPVSQESRPQLKETNNNVEEKTQLDAALENKFSTFFSSRADANPNNLNAQVENRFYEEEWNPKWAEHKENKIQTLFNQNKALQNLQPLDITCRSQNCQIILPAGNENQIHEFTTIFMSVAANSDLGMNNQSVSFFSDPASSSLVFYVSENQHESLLR